MLCLFWNIKRKGRLRWHFKEYTYKRPEIDEVKEMFLAALNRFKGAKGCRGTN